MARLQQGKQASGVTNGLAIARMGKKRQSYALSLHDHGRKVVHDEYLEK